MNYFRSCAKLSLVTYSIAKRLGYLFFCALLVSRLVFAGSVDPWLWVFAACLPFLIVYFPFTKKALTFHSFSLRKKSCRYFARCLTMDTVLGVLAALPVFFCLFTRTNECSAVFLFVPAAGAIVLLIGIQLLVWVVLIAVHFLDHAPRAFRLSAHAAIAVLLIVLNFDLVWFRELFDSRPKNAFFFETRQCDRLSVMHMTELEMREVGCHSFYKFDEQGNPKPLYRETAPINAFKKCSWFGEDSVGHIVDCFKRSDYPGKKIVASRSGHDTAPLTLQAKYGFRADESYFNVCKRVLSEKLEKLVSQCKRQ